jgi:hypothetical protein
MAHHRRYDDDKRRWSRYIRVRCEGEPDPEVSASVRAASPSRSEKCGDRRPGIKYVEDVEEEPLPVPPAR